MNKDLAAPQLRRLLRRVRSRWRRLVIYEATFRAALAAGAVLVLAFSLAGLTERSLPALAALGVVSLLLAIAGVIWGLLPARHVPTDARLARYIEEHDSTLEDRLASGLSLLDGESNRRPALATPMLADADCAAASVDPAIVVTDERLRKTGLQAAGALVFLIAVILISRGSARQSIDALSLTLFPARVSLEVAPGTVRIPAGTPLTIEARLVGNRAPAIARLMHVEEGAGDEWITTEMKARSEREPGEQPEQQPEPAHDGDGTYEVRLDAVNSSFKYRVVVGAVTSPEYGITVTRPPRVTRVEVDYRYPPSFGVEPHTDEDGGDIYAPAGTDVRVRVHVDRPAATGAMALGGGGAIALEPDTPNVMAAAFRLERDNSYRITLADREGVSSPGDTEYFIRILDDRPPEVRLVKPARDRHATKLEEISIEAKADDDFGVEQMELVYAVRGRKEQVVPFAIPRRSPSVAASRVLYLEDLDVEPGDFVSYYVRARDSRRGKRAGEGRSDIFFLEVKPFEQEFVLAPSLAANGNRPMDDLVAAQKDVIVATFKLDRRGDAANARPVEDIRAVAAKEAELQARVEASSSASRESTLRNPRRPGARSPDGVAGAPAASQDDPLTAAAMAMGRAVSALNELKTGEALPHEMEALNQLLRAQAEVRKQQISRQAGNGQNRATQDLSSLFDRELQRQQHTNYETPTSTEQRDTSSAPDRIKELARRQDELARRQQELADGRTEMSAGERQRTLEQLRREQEQLRRQAEDIQRELGSERSQASQRSQGSQGSAGSQGSQGSAAATQLRGIAEEMRAAAGDLQRQDPRQASERGASAVRRLRDLERRMRAAGPDDSQRALGEMQLETRQLAEAERQIAEELKKLGQGQAAADRLRRLAGDQERLADRTRRVQEGLERQAAALDGSAGDDPRKAQQQAVSSAARDLQRRRVAERMRQSAESMRAAARPGSPNSAGEQVARTAEGQIQVARELEELAEKLASAAAPRDEEARQLASRRARAQELRHELDRVAQAIEQATKEGGQGRQSARAGEKAPAGQTGEAGRSAGDGGGSGGAGADLAKLRDEYLQKMRESRELLEQLRREDVNVSQGGPGFTFEGQGMTLSAPGTEAFKHDFARWEQLRHQATQLLARAETELAKKLHAADARDRFAAGADDTPLPGYEQQVDQYYRGLAGRR